MSEYIDSFIKSHREYFKRNKKVIENNYWNNNTRHEKGLKSFTTQVSLIQTSDPKQKEKELEKLEKEIRSFVESSNKTKEALFKQENELTTSILGRLSVFISESEGDRSSDKRQDFIDETVEIIDLHLKKCDDYCRS